MKCYLDLVFDEDLKSAQRGKEVIHFTRAERRLLSALMKQPGRLLTREVLLDSVLADLHEGSDRNIDYLVSRLRKKLNEDLKAPRYIATRYGEGYVWVAQSPERQPSEAFLVLGPLHGLHGEEFEHPVASIINSLGTSLTSRLSRGKSVVVDAYFASDAATTDAEYALGFSFLRKGHRIEGRAVLHVVKTWNVVSSQKFTLEWPLSGSVDMTVNALVDHVLEQIVFHKTETGTQMATMPLEISLHEASRLLAIPDMAWLESGDMIARKRRENPEDPKFVVMWASHLYATLIFLPRTGHLDPQFWEDTEDEIERLCLATLPRVQDDALLCLCIGKLLLFIDRGHTPLVESLINAEYSREVAFSAVYPLLGQINAINGKFDDAIRYYDHALRTAERGSKYQVYLYVLKITALLAASRREEALQEADELYRIDPETITSVGLFIGEAHEPLVPEHASFLDQLGPKGAEAFVWYFYMVSARHFENPSIRDRVYGGFAGRVERRFGIRYVPPVG